MSNENTPYDETLRSLKASAELDQALASTKQMATVVASYYRELRKEGFSEPDALALTINMQNEVFRMAGRGKGGKP